MNDFQKIFDKQKVHFNSDITKTYQWRIDQLDRMEKMLKENQEKLNNAMGCDFKTAYAEQVFESTAPLATIAFTKFMLKKWMEPSAAPLPKFLTKTGHRGEIIREPYGVTLVICPFNGPLLLSLRPAITAIAAGNPVVLKLSESLKATNEILLELIPKYFEPESLTAFDGGRDMVTELLKVPFDFIFFTGSAPVGKVIMKAAAENLTPVLLELGGQNPVIVDETADIADAAKKIVWGAMAWGGQWCTSPGYACVHESVAEQFVAESIKAVTEMYGMDPKKSPDYSRMISGKAVTRLVELMKGSKVVAGGDYNERERYLAPTIVYPVKWTDKIMQDEIFGPVLPVLMYKDIKEVVSQIKSMPKPLAGFIFSSNEKQIQYLLNTISFGGGAVNQVNVHLFIETMPFGGVGSSGIGNYYGKYGFDSLTHAKSILYEPTGEIIDHLIPPYTPEKINGQFAWFDYDLG